MRGKEKKERKLMGAAEKESKSKKERKQKMVCMCRFVQQRKRG